MINTLLFDFGDVFLNLDKEATARELAKLGMKGFTPEMQQHNNHYEKGELSTEEFVTAYQNWFSQASKQQLINAWNAILLDFPYHRLTFLEQLAQSKKYRLFLLSNTNEIHIDWIKKNIDCYERFKNCFEKFYLSYEIHLRKPCVSIYEFILKENNLKASEVLFIDDTKENTNVAKTLGFHVWNIDPKTEDVTELLIKHSHLF